MNNASIVPDSDRKRRITALADCVRGLGAQGWTPATSSNFSVRLGDQLMGISISGRDKRQFSVQDVMLADFNGVGVDTQARPSAETLLHIQLYQRFPAVGAVLHTHSVTQTLASQVFAKQHGVEFSGYELLKALAGISSHEQRVALPIVPNSQDMRALAAAVEPLLNARTPCHGYLIEGHGLYAWGRDVDEARRHLEAFDFLLECELRKRSLMQ